MMITTTKELTALCKRLEKHPFITDIFYINNNILTALWYNMKFWRSIYKDVPRGEGSGTVPKINGWITKFFPYIDKIGQELSIIKDWPPEFIDSLEE